MVPLTCLKNKFILPSWLSQGVGIILVILLSWSFLLPSVSAQAASPLLAINSSQTTEIKVSLGNESNELKFFPNHLELSAGERYKLILNNPSPQKHYFTAKDFADASWTQKVEAGQVEVKGAIHELELKPGAEAEWILIPLKSGSYNLRCTIAGHTEAGMTGTISISANPSP